MPQYTFSQKDDSLIIIIDALAKKDNRSRSEMIVILLQYAVREKTRARKKKSGNQVQHQPAD